MKRSTLLILAVAALAGAGVVFAATSDVPTSGTVYVGANDAPSVGIAGGKTINMSSFGPAGETQVNLTNEGVIYADGDPDATLVVPSSETLDDSQASVEQIDTTGLVGLETPQTQRIVVGADIDRVTWRNPGSVALDDTTVDFAYGGASGTSIVDLGGVPVDTGIRAVDAQSGDVLAVAVSDSNGRVNFTDLPNSDHDVLLESASAPSLSNPSPTGDQSTHPDTLSVNVSDADFDADNVTVGFDVDGSDADSVTVSSNGTASIQTPSRGIEGGQHTVNVTATDGVGDVDRLNYTYRVPGTLTIYNESNVSQVIDNATVEVTAYYEQGGVQRSQTVTTSDGVLNLTGFPIDQPLVLSVQADGFRDRRIFLQSLFEQQRVYLLSASEQFTRTTFQLRDLSGDFPEDTTVLQVRRSLNGSFETVLGDYFGANNQFPAELAYNERHRLRLLNTETGETRDLGPYTPLSSGEETLAVSTTGAIERLSAGAQLAVSPSASNLPARNLTVTAQLLEQSDSITTYELTMFAEDANGNNQTLVSTTDRNISRAVNLSAYERGQLTVVAQWETDDGLANGESVAYNIVSDNSGGVNALGAIAALVGLLPGDSQAAFQGSAAILVTLLGTTMVASRGRLSTEAIGAVAVTFLLGFGILGWVGYDLIFIVLVAWGSLTFIRRGL